jgi:hypothetical protein
MRRSGLEGAGQIGNLQSAVANKKARLVVRRSGLAK